MMFLELTTLAKARIWRASAVPTFAPAGTLIEEVGADPEASLLRDRIGVEALVPRGARAEYGLVGVAFERSRTGVLQVHVPFTKTAGPSWPDSLARQLDDVRLGLPYEYAAPILAVASDSARQRFPAGTLKITHAAHGLVGSSGEFFGRLVIGALTLLRDANGQGSEETTVFLRELLVEGLFPRSSVT